MVLCDFKFLTKIQFPLSPYPMGNPGNSSPANSMPATPPGLSQILSMLGYSQTIIFNQVIYSANK
jgi:hypothetical protein